jgi:hypothetical protein
MAKETQDVDPTPDGSVPADVARKLEVIRAASRLEYPTADIELMLKEIERERET